MKSKNLFCLTALSACVLASYSVHAFEADAVESFNIWHSEEVSEKRFGIR